jgi:hypothetical protein
VAGAQLGEVPPVGGGDDVEAEPLRDRGDAGIHEADVGIVAQQLDTLVVAREQSSSDSPAAKDSANCSSARRAAVASRWATRQRGRGASSSSRRLSRSWREAACQSSSASASAYNTPVSTSSGISARRPRASARGRLRISRQLGEQQLLVPRRGVAMAASPHRGEARQRRELPFSGVRPATPRAPLATGNARRAMPKILLDGLVEKNRSAPHMTYASDTNRRGAKPLAPWFLSPKRRARTQTETLNTKPEQNARRSHHVVRYGWTSNTAWSARRTAQKTATRRKNEAPSVCRRRARGR